MSDLIKKIGVGDVIAERFEVTSIVDDNELGILALVNARLSGKVLLLLQLGFPVDSVREAEIRAAFGEYIVITHKSMGGLTEILLEESTCYILMDNIEGETLDAHLAKRREQGQMLGLKAAYSFIAHICQGIDVLHQSNHFYGKLSSRHIFVPPEGRVRIVPALVNLLADKYLEDEARKSYFGSLFCAPEVREEREKGSQAADVYSLSLLFAELLSSESLNDFTGSPEAFIAKLPNVSTNVKETLFQAAKMDAEDRFQSVQSFKDTLKRGVDAPSDSDLSSIVVGVNDLRSLNAGSSQSMNSAPVAKKPDLFEAGSMSRSLARMINPEVWIFQKDGMDFGPFDHAGLIQKFYDDVITESTGVYNISTKKRQNLGSIEEFQKEITEYLPIREHNRAQRQAEQRKKDFQKKAGIGGVIVAVSVAVLAALLVPVLILALMPKPEALDLTGAFPAFEKRFEVPKSEEFSLNMDDSQAKALFDPKASEAEIEAALAAWEAEHRKKYAGKRRPKRGMGGGAGGAGDEIDTIVFTGEDGEELEPLENWEIEEQCMSPRIVRRQAECFQKYAGGRRFEVTINFTIQQSGTVRNFSTTAPNGDLNDCLISTLSSIKFRQFGGTTKKVKLPVGYY